MDKMLKNKKHYLSKESRYTLEALHISSDRGKACKAHAGIHKVNAALGC